MIQPPVVQIFRALIYPVTSHIYKIYIYSIKYRVYNIPSLYIMYMQLSNNQARWLVFLCSRHRNLIDFFSSPLGSEVGMCTKSRFLYAQKTCTV